MLEVAEVAAPTIEELEALLLKIITRVMRLLTRKDFSSKNKAWPTSPKRTRIPGEDIQSLGRGIKRTISGS
jgi:hypothetical protein